MVVRLSLMVLSVCGIGCLTSHDALANGIPMVTLVPEHVRGRYTYSIYLQMGHTDLITYHTQEYIALVMRLLQDDAYRAQQSEAIRTAYDTRFHRNGLVAEEWVAFLDRLLTTTSPIN
jgi:predicted O-linked N-acetylglucosamine transferase (SPINDLY family)